MNKSKTGRDLTDEALEKLADRFEDGLDPAKLRPRRTGRPPLGDDFPSPRLQVRLPRPLYLALSQRAHAEGTSVSALVRYLLEVSATERGPRAARGPQQKKGIARSRHH